MPSRANWAALLLVPLAASCGEEPDHPAGSSAAPASPAAAGAADLEDYDFTIDAVRRFARAHRTLRDAGLRIPGGPPPAEGEALPAVVRQVVEEAGLDPDEFLIIQRSLLPAYLVARLREAGMPASERPGGVREAHVAFVERHRGEIEELLDLDG